MASMLTFKSVRFLRYPLWPNSLPRFWIFMYRVNPFTYLVSSLLWTTLGDAPVACADNEFQSFSALANESCSDYTQEYISRAGGYLRNPDSTGDELCNYCRMSSTNQFLAGISINYSGRWRDWGILCVYIVFNISAVVFLYWLMRVPKEKKKAKKE